MNELKHEPEFRPKSVSLEKHKQELAETYMRLFTSADGKRVLKDFYAKINPKQSRFDPVNPNAVKAARIEGKCDVWREIEEALALVGVKIETLL